MFVYMISWKVFIWRCDASRRIHLFITRRPRAPALNIWFNFCCRMPAEAQTLPQPACWRVSNKLTQLIFPLSTTLSGDLGVHISNLKGGHFSIHSETVAVFSTDLNELLFSYHSFFIFHNKILLGEIVSNVQKYLEKGKWCRKIIGKLNFLMILRHLLQIIWNKLGQN